MPRKVRQVYTNFSSGEINNLLNARTDAKAYFEYIANPSISK